MTDIPSTPSDKETFVIFRTYTTSRSHLRPLLIIPSCFSFLIQFYAVHTTSHCFGVSLTVSSPTYFANMRQLLFWNCRWRLWIPWKFFWIGAEVRTVWVVRHIAGTNVFRLVMLISERGYNPIILTLTNTYIYSRMQNSLYTTGEITRSMRSGETLHVGSHLMSKYIYVYISIAFSSSWWCDQLIVKTTKGARVAFEKKSELISEFRLSPLKLYEGAVQTETGNLP